jgi:hypothetical protein
MNAAIVYLIHFTLIEKNKITINILLNIINIFTKWEKIDNKNIPIILKEM